MDRVHILFTVGSLKQADWNWTADPFEYSRSDPPLKILRRSESPGRIRLLKQNQPNLTIWYLHLELGDSHPGFFFCAIVAQKLMCSNGSGSENVLGNSVYLPILSINTKRHWGVAQLAERLPVKEMVAGSTPATPVLCQFCPASCRDENLLVGRGLFRFLIRHERTCSWTADIVIIGNSLRPGQAANTDVSSASPRDHEVLLDN